MRLRSGVSLALLRVCFCYYHGIIYRAGESGLILDWQDRISRIRYDCEINAAIQFSFYFRGKVNLEIF